MNMNNNNVNSIRSTLNALVCVTQESTMEVLDSMISAYDKAETILENYDGDDISAFSFFQEGKIMDEVKKQGKGDKNVGKTILLFIPRLITALFNAITSSTKNVIEDIKDDIPKVTIEKAKKEPNWFMKIIKSKPVKTLSLITTTVGVTKAVDEVKKSINLAKEVKESAMSIAEMVQKRGELLKKSPVIEWDNSTLMLSTSLKYDEIEGFGSKYFIECLSIIRVAKNDIKKCKNIAEALSVLSNLQKEFLKYMYPFEVLLGTINGDNVVMNGPIKPKDLDGKLKAGIVNLKKVNRDDIKKAMTDLYDAIPRDTLTKGISNKVSMAVAAKKISGDDNKGDDSFAVVDKTFKDTANAITSLMMSDIKMYCDIISAIRIHIHDTFKKLIEDLKSVHTDKPKEDEEPVNKENNQ